MFSRLGKFVTRRWPLVIAFWIIALVVLRFVAPAWDDITRDGDFQYLPANSPSVVGQRLLDRAFPNRQSKSQIVVVIAREQGEPQTHDLFVAYELARRIHNLAGVAAYGRALRLRDAVHTYREQHPTPMDDSEQAHLAQLEADFAATLEVAKEEFDRAVELTRDLFEFLDDLKAEDKSPTLQIADPELAIAFHNRGIFQSIFGDAEAADTDRIIASRLFEADKIPTDPIPREALEYPISETWTWQSDEFGSAMMEMRGRKAYARLVILHLPTEFLAVENVELFSSVQQQVTEVNAWADEFQDEGLEVGVSGSAAVGSDLLQASVDSIRHTELFTIILVTLILAFVYRSPLLIGLPLITIGVALAVSICVLSLLTQIQFIPGMGWFDFNVYKTTRIFIVVVLFGAGTDYCLFLVSRYREELAKGLTPQEAVPLALSRVGDALAASALTTVVGLGMMFFAQFGKLRNSGPAIAICLVITLAACITLAPALLRAYGRWAFWPGRVRRSPGGQAPNEDLPDTANNDSASVSNQSLENASQDEEDANVSSLWVWVAKFVTTFPGLILIFSYALVLPLAYFGFQARDHVTYDMLQSLDRDRPSRDGAELLRRHFPVGESGPVVVLAEHPQKSFWIPENADSFEHVAAIDDLQAKLQTIEGVSHIRSLASPLGNAGETRTGVINTSIRSIPQVQDLYVSQEPGFGKRVTRFEVVLQYDAFSLDATQVIDEIESTLSEERIDDESFWKEAEFSFAGTSAAIRDLRRVTQSDTIRIQILVVIAVFAVLFLILRHPLTCLYMIATVLVSYFVTLGLTDAFFMWLDGEDYQGMDWKVPLFLFVILVAVGADYNVYLASRVFEEQKRFGKEVGLRRAVARTGSIISSCGIIMAGTFFSMTSGMWSSALPPDLPLLSGLFSAEGGSLRGIVQMGFALSLGVLLDTFFVRPILLPAFMALANRFAPDRQS